MYIVENSQKLKTWSIYQKKNKINYTEIIRPETYSTQEAILIYSSYY